MVTDTGKIDRKPSGLIQRIITSKRNWVDDAPQGAQNKAAYGGGELVGLVLGMAAGMLAIIILGIVAALLPDAAVTSLQNFKNAVGWPIPVGLLLFVGVLLAWILHGTYMYLKRDMPSDIWTDAEVKAWRKEHGDQRRF